MDSRPSPTRRREALSKGYDALDKTGERPEPASYEPPSTSRAETLSAAYDVIDSGETETTAEAASE